MLSYDAIDDNAGVGDDDDNVGDDTILPFLFPANFVSYPLSDSDCIVYRPKNNITEWENCAKYNSNKKSIGKQTACRCTHVLLLFYFIFFVFFLSKW
jgi:hypothetical protein